MILLTFHHFECVQKDKTTTKKTKNKHQFKNNTIENAIDVHSAHRLQTVNVLQSRNAGKKFIQKLR